MKFFDKLNKRECVVLFIDDHIEPGGIPENSFYIRFQTKDSRDVWEMAVSHQIIQNLVVEIIKRTEWREP